MNNHFTYRGMHESNEGRRARRRLLLVTFLVVGVLVVDFVTGGAVREMVRTGSSASWRMWQSVVTRIGESGIFATRASLARQNALLQSQIAGKEESAAAFVAVSAENEQLRAFVHLAESTPGVTAPITSSFMASPYGTFTIGAGSEDGVMKGNRVLTPDGFVLGRVESASSRDALVTALFAPGKTVEVRIGDIPLVLRGRGGGSADGDAPRGSVIHEGDVAFAPSLKGSSVGVVRRVEGDDTSSKRIVFVQLPINLASLSYVYVEITH